MLERLWSKGNPHTSVGKNILINWCSLCGKQHEDSSENKKIELPYDPAILLLGVTMTQKIHSPLCSLQHYSQRPRHGNNLTIHQQMNG